MRAEVEIGVGELAPGGDNFVRFAGVGIEKVLEERILARGMVFSGMAVKEYSWL